MKKSVTIYDIAKIVGTSATTVSRALNGKGNLSEEMRAVIIEKAKELNYAPNPAARYLKTQKTNQIMLSIPSLQDLFFIDMIKVIQQIATKQEYSLLVHSTQYSEDEELRILSTIGNNFIDGVIMVSLNLTQKHFDAAAETSRSVVLCSTGTGNVQNLQPQSDFIGVDSYLGFKMAAKHIIEQGHTDIGYLGFYPETHTETERLQAFVDIMEEHGLPINRDNVLQGAPDEEFGYRAGKHFASAARRPTAICATADMMVLGLYRAFEEAGLAIPDDIAVIGMDNTNIDTIMRPHLSSVALNQAELGRLAVEVLFRRIEGSREDIRNILLQPQLIIRESSVSK